TGSTCRRMNWRTRSCRVRERSECWKSMAAPAHTLAFAFRMRRTTKVLDHPNSHSKERCCADKRIKQRDIQSANVVTIDPILSLASSRSSVQRYSFRNGAILSYTVFV